MTDKTRWLVTLTGGDLGEGFLGYRFSTMAELLEYIEMHAEDGYTIEIREKKSDD